MANSIGAAAARGTRGLLVFVLLAAVPAPLFPSRPLNNHRLLVSATTSTSASYATTEDCDGDAAIDACNADADCSACFSDWGAETSSTTVAPCEDRYPGATASLCEQSGAGFCCNLGGEATAEACMRNTLFVEFLGCFMTGFQCSIEDMPCFDSSVFTAAPTTSPTPALTEPPSEQPTPSPATPSSYEDRGFETTASPTASGQVGVVTLPNALMEACEEEAAACVADEACQQGCIFGNLEMVAVATSGDGESYSSCQLDYLLGEETTSTGSISDVCDVVSSAFCCSGSAGVDVDGADPLECATNEAAQELWSCAFEFYDCSMADATCADDDGTSVNSAPGGAVPGGYSEVFGVLGLSSCVALVLGLVTVEL
eukprot:g6411.t1